MAVFWERAVHSVNVCSVFIMPILLCFSHFGIEGVTLVLIAPALGHC